MFGNRNTDEFVNDISQSGSGTHTRSQWRLLIVIVCGICGFLAWAHFFEVEEVTRGSGRVIPSSQVQPVQSLEGGVVRSVEVREGDLVEAGDVLMKIDDTSFSSQRGELLEREAALRAEEIRLRAEARFQDELTFPDDLNELNPRAAMAEREVFLSRRLQLQGELVVLENRLSQRKAEYQELQAMRLRGEAVLLPLREEMTLTTEMVRKGVVPQIELMRLTSRTAELEGDLAVGRATEPKLLAAIQEAESQIEASRSAYALSARERLAKLQLELAVVKEALRAANMRVTRTELRAPTRGTVNTISVQTVGAVIQPGAVVAEIVPADDGLLIEAQVRPKDVAFIRTGEDVSVKITAYDYLVYGALDGKVVRIGADTIEDRQGEEFFRVVVRTDRNYLGTEENRLPIIPGMIASIDIQTGKKSVLSYLSKPLLRGRSEALRER